MCSQYEASQGFETKKTLRLQWHMYCQTVDLAGLERHKLRGTEKPIILTMKQYTGWVIIKLDFEIAIKKRLDIFQWLLLYLPLNMKHDISRRWLCSSLVYRPNFAALFRWFWALPHDCEVFPARNNA